MERLIIVSNRLPLSITKDDDEITVTPSVGGLATGLKSFYKVYEGKWFGWPGIDRASLTKKEQQTVEAELEKENCVPVYLTEAELEDYYYGFSNKTIWPLFHYFMQYTHYNNTYWEMYKQVNQKFADAIVKELKPGDRLWIHDYHLLLLPKMIRDAFPEVNIGFFLHIPFPSYEIFRNLPWRREIIDGLLASDLIGFHTYGYERHFMSSVRRLLGYENHFNQITVGRRIVQVDNFPMGIDYDRFHNAAQEQQQLSVKDKSDVQQEIDRYFLFAADRKLILSIDRLDYSKGIANRLRAYEQFLAQHPEYHSKISLILLAVPSRQNVEQYQQMKREVDELVGRINGEYGQINWTPVWYFYRSMPFNDLISLYNSCDIALITPLRDGMNLVAKEYIAAKIDNKGVLILSEMAGAAREMGEALIVNPNNHDEIVNAIIQALNMPESEKMNRGKSMQERLKRYNVDKWAKDFMDSLSKIKQLNDRNASKKIDSKVNKQIKTAYGKAKKRMLFLDYDGTLVGFRKNPLDAKPDKELYGLLRNFIADKKNHVAIISGRRREELDNWFGKEKGLSLIVEHGIWSKQEDGEWKLIESFDNSWKELVRPIIEFTIDRTPGSFLEEKRYSLAWHYRKADPDLGTIRSNELKDELLSFVANHNIEILEGNKVVEIKNSGFNKGRAATNLIGDEKYDFIMAIGDDWTDEYLFENLPDSAYTIKVGLRNTTKAHYNIESPAKVRELLQSLL